MIQRHTTKKYADHPYFKAGEAISKEEGLELHHKLLNMLKSRLKPEACILDVGAGTGDFLAMASSYFKMKGIEPSPYLAERIQRRTGCKVFVGAFEDYDGKDEFDAVVLMDIIEHTSDPRVLLKKVFKVLRSGGLLFISTVENNSLLYKLAPLIWKASRYSDKARYILQRIFCYQHNWYYNKYVLKNLIEQSGFSVLEHQGFEFPIKRLNENFILLFGLRFIYMLNALLGLRTEQCLLAQK
jgi:2-polyprenyl-3-methyl-5-hydroxy-6-metoxy-1,4-benzoquinol methylase